MEGDASLDVCLSKDLMPVSTWCCSRLIPRRLPRCLFFLSFIKYVAMKIQFLLSAFLILLLLACDKEKQEPQEPVVPYWRLGNTWNYQMTNNPLYSSEIFRLDAIGLDRHTFSRTFSNGDVYLHFEYYENGYLYKQPESSPLADKYLKYKDLKVGDIWADLYRDYEVVALQETITVPAGTFSCTKVKSITKDWLPSGGNETSYSYYSEQYGLIKVEGMDPNVALVSKNF
jgi:hypothetical protein